MKIYGMLKRLTSSDRLDLELEGSATVFDVLREAARQLGSEFGGSVIDSGRISGNIVVVLNGTDIDSMEGADTPVHDGDEIVLLPHIQGGGVSDA
ncbi:MAG: MoaD/ThiS family protein [Candidatus Thorarchaeota archaeon]